MPSIWTTFLMDSRGSATKSSYRNLRYRVEAGARNGFDVEFHRSQRRAERRGDILSITPATPRSGWSFNRAQEVAAERGSRTS